MTHAGTAVLETGQRAISPSTPSCAARIRAWTYRAGLAGRTGFDLPDGV